MWKMQRTHRWWDSGRRNQQRSKREMRIRQESKCFFFNGLNEALLQQGSKPPGQAMKYHLHKQLLLIIPWCFLVYLEPASAFISLLCNCRPLLTNKQRVYKLWVGITSSPSTWSLQSSAVFRGLHCCKHSKHCSGLANQQLWGRA